MVRKSGSNRFNRRAFIKASAKLGQLSLRVPFSRPRCGPPRP